MTNSEYDPAIHGTESRKLGDERMRSLWETRPESKNAKVNGVYWPVEAVWYDNAISPRADGHTDPARVELYSQILEKLPPIKVRAVTGQLIDGKHRLEAAVLAGHDHIRVFEIDIADGDLFEAAYLANMEHGYGYSDRERAAGARRIWMAKTAAGEELNQSEFASHYCVSRRTVVNWVQAARGPVEAETPYEAARDDAGGEEPGQGDYESDPPRIGPYAASASHPAALEPPAKVAAPKGHSLFPSVITGILDAADLEAMYEIPVAEFLANLPQPLGGQLTAASVTSAQKWITKLARAMRTSEKEDAA